MAELAADLAGRRGARACRRALCRPRPNSSVPNGVCGPPNVPRRAAHQPSCLPSLLRASDTLVTVTVSSFLRLAQQADGWLQGAKVDPLGGLSKLQASRADPVERAP